MAVEFTCPECGNTARIVAGGFVEAHEATAGKLCAFTRTARSGTRTPSAALTPAQEAKLERQRAELTRLTNRKAANETISSKTKSAALTTPPAPPKEPTKTQRPSFFIECAKCRVTVKVRSETHSGRLPAHQRSSGRWCSAGAEPTEGQKKRSGARRSVHTVTGGLPGLGKR
jgi:hypothetical protein